MAANLERLTEQLIANYPRQAIALRMIAGDIRTLGGPEELPDESYRRPESHLDSTTLEIDEQQLLNTIVENLGPGLIVQGQQVVDEMIKHAENKGQVDVRFGIPYRESLEDEVFKPNYARFVALMDSLPVTADMERYAAQNGITPEMNTHQGIFHSESYLLKDNWRTSQFEDLRQKHVQYSAFVRGQGDIIMTDVSVIPEKPLYPVINPLVFYGADARSKLSFKILDQVFHGDWEYGSSLEVGDRSIYETGSFVLSLADRIQIMTRRWIDMDDTDKKAWIGEGWTKGVRQDRDGRHYDLVNIATRNRHIG